jgi:hypothetical protein
MLSKFPQQHPSYDQTLILELFTLQEEAHALTTHDKMHQYPAQNPLRWDTKG